jgi:hypothetical protein
MKALKIHFYTLCAMEKTRNILVTIVVLAFGLIFASIAAHAQPTNNTGGNMTSMANKTNATKSPTAMGGGNATSPSSAQSAMTNATSAGGGAMKSNATNATSAGGGASNATNASSSNPLAKVPIIGKLFGGK